MSPAATPAPAPAEESVPPAPPAPVAATTLPLPTHPDGDYIIVGSDAYTVSGLFCDVLSGGGGAPGSVDGEIREMDGTAEGLGSFFYEISDSGLADNKPRDGLFSISSEADNGALYFAADGLVIDAPLMGPQVQLSGNGALDPTNTLDAYLAALSSAIGADRLDQITNGVTPTDAESATLLQMHGQYYATPFWLSVTCPG